MVNSQKVVVILLLITIILSIVSVVLTFSTTFIGGQNTKIVTNNQGPSSGQIAFRITPESERGSTG